MTRLTKLTVEELPEDIREMTKADDRTALELGLTRIFAHRPELTKGMMPFSRALKVHRLLDNRLIELVRLRIAFFNQCRSCMAIRYPDALADGLTEDLVCSLEKPQEAENLTEREKLAVLYAERFATDHLSIGDDLYARLKEHFSEPEIVELGFHCAFYVGFGRLAATWNMVEELPDEYQDMSHEVAPWSIDDHVVMR